MNKALDRYVPKSLQTFSSIAVPIHPDKIIETSILTKEIEELRTNIKELETRLERLQDSEQLISYLENFKKQFELHCVQEGHKISILRCATLQSLKFCSFRNKCKGRLELGKKLKYL